MKNMTVQEYASKIGVATSTVYRRIERGALQALSENGVQMVIVPDDSTDNNNAEQDTNFALQTQHIDELNRQIERLESQLDAMQESRNHADKIIQQMQADLESSKERSDTIVLQLTQQLDKLTEQNQALTQQNQLLLEDLRPKRRFWKRLFAWNGG